MKKMRWIVLSWMIAIPGILLAEPADSSDSQLEFTRAHLNNAVIAKSESYAMEAQIELFDPVSYSDSASYSSTNLLDLSTESTSSHSSFWILY